MKLFMVKLAFCLILNIHFLKVQAHVDDSNFEQVLRIWDGTFAYRFVTIEESESHFLLKLEGAALEKIIETHLLYGHIEFAPLPKSLIREFVFLSDKKNCESQSRSDSEESYFLDCLLMNSASEIHIKSGDSYSDDPVISKGVIKPVWGKIDLNLSFSLEGNELILNLTTTHSFPLTIFQVYFFHSIPR